MNGFSSVVAKIKPSVVLVLIVDESNRTKSKGSGFVFHRPGIIVTCNHVVSNTGGGAALVKFSDEQDPKPAKILLRDEEHDLALLQVTDDSHMPLMQASAENISEGMTVIYSGFPLDLFSLTTHQGILAAIIKDAAGITNYLVDGTVNGGNSGCPLMNSDGNVIGVINAKRREQSNLLTMVERMPNGASSVWGVDTISIYRAIIDNLQLGIGYAVPCAYIPSHSEPEIKVEALIRKENI
ncbi:MAG: serine protease [Microgenomates group bacterium]